MSAFILYFLDIKAAIIISRKIQDFRIEEICKEISESVIKNSAQVSFDFILK